MYASRIEVKPPTKVEQVAAWLIRRGVSFDYTPRRIVVRDPDFTTFSEASYHAETRKLVLMDSEWREVPASALA
jgi:hypothetical protein